MLLRVTNHLVTIENKIDALKESVEQDRISRRHKKKESLISPHRDPGPKRLNEQSPSVLSHEPCNLFSPDDASMDANRSVPDDAALQEEDQHKDSCEPTAGKPSPEECSVLKNGEDMGADVMAIVGDPKYGIRTETSVLKTIIEKNSTTPAALALNLLDNLVLKEIQAISNVSGMNGKQKLDEVILLAIRTHVKRTFKQNDATYEEIWGGKKGLRQKIADKCRNCKKKLKTQ